LWVSLRKDGTLHPSIGRLSPTVQSPSHDRRSRGTFHQRCCSKHQHTGHCSVLPHHPMATQLHPLAHLTQLIHSEPSSFSDEPITYILHSSVDSSKKHWKVRLYTFVGPDDAEGDDDDGNDGREQGGIWLYKGYMTIKDVCRMIEDDLHKLTDPHNEHPRPTLPFEQITNHLSSRVTSSISTTSSSKPSSESAQVTAASYLRDCILEGKSHIHVNVGDDNEDGGGRKGKGKRKRKRKRTKSDDGEGEIQSMHSEISVCPYFLCSISVFRYEIPYPRKLQPQLVLDHTHRSPLILPLTLSSPKMYSIPRGESTGNGNMDAQKGLMELCSEVRSSSTLVLPIRVLIGKNELIDGLEMEHGEEGGKGDF